MAYNQPNFSARSTALAWLSSQHFDSVFSRLISTFSILNLDSPLLRTPQTSTQMPSSSMLVIVNKSSSLISESPSLFQPWLLGDLTLQVDSEKSFVTTEFLTFGLTTGWSWSLSFSTPILYYLTTRLKLGLSLVELFALSIVAGWDLLDLTSFTESPSE